MKRPFRLANTKLALIIFMFFGLFLLGIYGGEYRRSSKRAREVVTNHDLAILRHAIKTFTTDKLRPPQSLQDLLNEHYVRVIPNDSLTGKPDWVLHFGNVKVDPGKTLYGIDDIHSSAMKIDSESIPYNE